MFREFVNVYLVFFVRGDVFCMRCMCRCVHEQNEKKKRDLARSVFLGCMNVDENATLY